MKITIIKIFICTILFVPLNNFLNSYIPQNFHKITNKYIDAKVGINNELVNDSKDVIKGRKTVNYKNKFGNILWSLTVEAKFEIKEKTAVCTESKIFVKSNNSNWKVTDFYCSKTKNIAIASATGKRYLLNIPMQDINKIVELHCSNTGELY